MKTKVFFSFIVVLENLGISNSVLVSSEVLSSFEALSWDLTSNYSFLRLELPTPGEAKAKAMPGRLYIHTKINNNI